MAPKVKRSNYLEGRVNASRFEERLNRAVDCHRKGDLSQAERIYRETLAGAPNHVGALHLLGLAMIQTGRPSGGVELIDKALAIKPNYVEALMHRGIGFHQLKRFKEAVDSYDRALALKPDYLEALVNRGDAQQALNRFENALESYNKALAIKPDYLTALNNRGVVLKGLNRREPALESYDKALAINPNYVDALNNRGNVLYELMRLEEALESYDKALALKPDYADAYINRGNVLRALKRPQQALESFENALALKPDSADAHNNLGTALQELDRFEEALASFNRALANAPRYAAALNNRGETLRLLGRPHEALESLDRALAIRPDYAEAFNNRGNALYDLMRLDEALQSFDRALAIQPHNADALNNRGGALKELKRIDEALVAYDRALAIKPDRADIICGRGYAALLNGDFRAGWLGQESRWDRKDTPKRHLEAAYPVWRGDNILGKKIMVYDEQGLGDIIQFSRYLKLLSSAGAEITLKLRPSMHKLLAHVDDAVRVTDILSADESFDYQCALLSLPLGFGTTLETVPAETPYLRAEAERDRKWRERLGDKGFKIGVAWQGNKATKIDIGRSFRLAEFLGVSRIPNVRLISLQKNQGTEQLGELPQDMKIETLGDDYDAGDDAFLDSAAVMQSLDLVISSDTSIAHLAGALGRPVWVALKYVPDWRWMLDRTDSPWYPSMRLFRQRTIGDWRGPFAEMESALRGIVAESPRNPTQRAVA